MNGNSGPTAADLGMEAYKTTKALEERIQVLEAKIKFLEQVANAFEQYLKAEARWLADLKGVLSKS